jgi:predicted alpha/beta-fold hydrolase
MGGDMMNSHKSLLLFVAGVATHTLLAKRAAVITSTTLCSKAPLTTNTCSSSSSESSSQEVAQYLRSATSRHHVVDSFNASSFVPYRGLYSLFLPTTNPHFQTIVGSEAIKTMIFGRVQRTFGTTVERIVTPDSDFFDIELTDNVGTASTIVIVLHGLESNTRGTLVTKMANAFLSKNTPTSNNFACCLVSFRGCNGEPNNTVGSYHFGFTKDIAHLMTLLPARYPDKTFMLAGFSLGGNVVLKYLGGSFLCANLIDCTNRSCRLIH